MIETITAALTILKDVMLMEKKLDSTNVELVTMTPDRLFNMFTKEEVQVVVYINLVFKYVLYIFNCMISRP